MSETATEKAVKVMQHMGGDMLPCSVCRGGWFYERGECFGAVHNSECPHRDAEPPAYNQDTNGEDR